MKQYVMAVVGATGMVGSKFLQVLEERKLPVSKYYLFAIAKSAGKEIDFMGEKHTVIELTPENIKGKDIDVALFSAGGSISKEYAPLFAEMGVTVIDNSSQWRMHDDVPLVVPEVNGEAALNNKGIIAKGSLVKDTTIQLIDKLVTEDSMNVTLFYGKDVAEDDANALAEELEQRYPDCDINMISGEQPVYYYIISIE